MLSTGQKTKQKTVFSFFSAVYWAVDDPKLPKKSTFCRLGTVMYREIATFVLTPLVRFFENVLQNTPQNAKNFSRGLRPRTSGKIVKFLHHFNRGVLCP